MKKISLAVAAIVLLISIFAIYKYISRNNGFMDETYSHEESWDFYIKDIDGVKSSIMLDLGLKHISPVKNASNLVWIKVYMKDFDENGLPKNEESQKLYEIEDMFNGSFEEAYNSIFAGRLTSGGERTFYFYMSNPSSYERVVKAVMKEFSDYKYEYGMKKDEEWKEYKDVLFPSDEEYQSIMNRRVVKNLEESGDDLSKPREVSHWLFFKSELDMDNFVKAIKDEKFDIVEKVEDDHNYDREYPYKLVISRVDKVGYKDIDNYTLMLYGLVMNYNGFYDGWETSVEK